MLKEKLIQIGLTEYEATIYTFLLQTGSATAQKLYTTTSINRVTTYNVLDSLMKKGLVSSLDTPKKKLFRAESPQHLLSFLETKKRNWNEEGKHIDDNEQRLKKFLPELTVAYDSIGERPSVRFFEGIESLKDIHFELALQKGGKIYQLTSKNFVREAEIKGANDQAFKARMEKILEKSDIQLHEIWVDDVAITSLQSNLQIFHANSKEFPVNVEVVVGGNKVVILSTLGNLTGVVIENKDIAAGLVSLFRMAIKGLQK